MRTVKQAISKVNHRSQGLVSRLGEATTICYRHLNQQPEGIWNDTNN